MFTMVAVVGGREIEVRLRIGRRMESARNWFDDCSRECFVRSLRLFRLLSPKVEGVTDSR